MPAHSTSTDLNEYLASRYVTPADLVDTLNPERLMAHGSSTEGIGADPAFTGGPFYVFFTKPDLNLETELAVNIIRAGTPTAPRPLVSLLTGGTGIIPLLSNLCTGISIGDITLEVQQVGEGWDGSRLTVPKSTLTSRQDGTLSLEFQEWSGLPVTLLTKIWVDYIDAVTRGILAPASDKRYLQQRILDYAVAIYYFQMQPDGQTVEFGTKYTGCFPVSIPYSAYGSKVGDSPSPVSLSIPFAFSYCEPMDNAIFEEFAEVVKSHGVTLGVGSSTPPPAGAAQNSNSTGRKAYRMGFGTSVPVNILGGI